MLLAVDDDGGDLLVHEDEDGAEQGGQHRHQQRPPRVVPQRVHQPAAVLGGGLAGSGPSRLLGHGWPFKKDPTMDCWPRLANWDTFYFQIN